MLQRKCYLEYAYERITWMTWNDSKVKLNFGTLLIVIEKLVVSKREIVGLELQTNLK